MDWCTRIAIFCSITLASLAFFDTAAAEEFCNCDPSVEDCTCPSNLGEYDACVRKETSEMITPQDPAQLRDAAQIRTSYDSETDTYTVTADVRDLNARGTLPLHPNRGKWDTPTSFRNYLSTLLGLSSFPEDCFNRFEFKQTGRIRRINQFEGKMADARHMHVVFAAISNGAGKTTVDSDGDGAFFDDGWWAIGSMGQGDLSCTKESASDLSGQQCSVYNMYSRRTGWPRDVCSGDQAEFETETVVQSRIFDPRWNGVEVFGRCIEGTGVFGGCQGYTLQVIEYDEASLESRVYDSNSGDTNTRFRGPVNNTQQVTDKVHKGPWDGICTHGKGVRKEQKIRPLTAVGSAPDPDGDPTECGL